MTDAKYMRPGIAFAVGKTVEELGELQAALGKTIRWGWASYNPELPEAERETNLDWVKREMQDVRDALDNLDRELSASIETESTTRETQASICDWARGIGINCTALRGVERAGEEMEEALADLRAGEANKALVEIADVMICLFIAADQIGDLQKAIDVKMSINRARSWRIDESGCAYHIKNSPAKTD